LIRYFILLVVAGIVGGIIAMRKGRNPLLWFIICALIPLLVAVILVLPPVVSRGYTKKCPFCAEIIKEDATFCKHCGREQPIEMARIPPGYPPVR